MDEQVLIKQIAGMFEAQSARLREEIAAQTVQLRGEMDAQFVQMREEMHACVGNAVADVVQAVGEQFDRQKADIINEVRALAENIEGDQIRILSEEARGDRRRLAEYEERIGNLEKLVSAG